MALQWGGVPASEGRTISKNAKYSDLVILDKEAFDPEAVFLDTIVEEDVLPTLSLAVDGLTTPVDGNLDMPSAEALQRETIQPSKILPDTTLDPEQLEVYGWESSLWRKIIGYLGF